MEKVLMFLLIATVCVVSSSRLKTTKSENEALAPAPTDEPAHSIRRRFINPMFAFGTADNDNIVKMRTKRSEEDCEKLQLCKLHARSRRNFFAAYQLYFVNKENALLWDHHARSMAACEERYGRCYE